MSVKMSCGGCAKAVTNALNKVEGELEPRVSPREPARARAPHRPREPARRTAFPPGDADLSAHRPRAQV